MNTNEIHDLIFEEGLEGDLIGNVELIDDAVVWSYDALGEDYDDLQTHLIDVFDDDQAVLEEFIIENKLNEFFTITAAEFDELIIRFKIIEN